MVVIYASWQVNASDRCEYDLWFLSKVAECQREPGCLKYEYLVDQQRPGRGSNFEVWADAAALEAHLLSADHIEIVRDNSGRWGSSDFEIEFWDEAAGHRAIRVDASTNTVGIHGPAISDAAEATLAEWVARPSAPT